MRLVEENTGWEVAFAIAVERDKNIQRLCKAVLIDDHKTAKLLAKELEENEEMPGITPREYGRASR